MAFVALSQGKLLNMLRSTALFGSITHMNLIPFVEIRLVADKIYVHCFEVQCLFFLQRDIILKKYFKIKEIIFLIEKLLLYERNNCI
jgi:hypothetical protein